MKVHEHFGLKRAAFEIPPDPRFFFKAKCHLEALALFQYALHARKACSAIVGESGLGKTLVARTFCTVANKKSPVVWIHGIGQPDDATELEIYPPGSFSRACFHPPHETLTLAEWAHRSHTSRTPSLMIVDDADELPRGSWDEILSLLTRDAMRARRTNIVLMGLPCLADILAAPEMTRFGRRVFRLYTLSPLTPSETREYMQRRVNAAAGRIERVFADEAIDAIHQITNGSPALINQLCDNAMLNAFSDGRVRVEPRDVREAVQCSIGVRRSAPRSAAPPTIRSDVVPYRRFQAPPGNPLAAATVEQVPFSRSRSNPMLPARTAIDRARLRSVPAPRLQAPGVADLRPPAHDGRMVALEERVRRVMSVISEARALRSELSTVQSRAGTIPADESFTRHAKVSTVTA